ncbi:MAG: hypothetical protein LBN02_06900 [Oscillospiraceae bacterium]|nr:hypothetical protein [Oscillospiraceae bacterium]
MKRHTTRVIRIRRVHSKLDIRDDALLSQAEARLTYAKASLLEKFPIDGNFDFAHYKRIHRYLFEDINMESAAR